MGPEHFGILPAAGTAVSMTGACFILLIRRRPAPSSCREAAEGKRLPSGGFLARESQTLYMGETGLSTPHASVDSDIIEMSDDETRLDSRTSAESALFQSPQAPQEPQGNLTATTPSRAKLLAVRIY
jgi:hypothetical protein